MHAEHGGLRAADHRRRHRRRGAAPRSPTCRTSSRDRALQGAERLGARDAIAEVLRSLGDLAAAQGSHAAALGAVNRALEIWRGLGVLRTARTLARLEYVLRQMGDTTAAVACHREWQAVLTELSLDERCLRLPPFMRW